MLYFEILVVENKNPDVIILDKIDIKSKNIHRNLSISTETFPCLVGYDHSFRRQQCIVLASKCVKSILLM